MIPTPDQRANHVHTPDTGRGQGPLLEVFLGLFDRLKGLVMGMGLSVTDAEDVLQDVSIQVLNQAGRSTSDGNLTAWLFKVTVNRVRLEHRRRGVANKGSAAFLQKSPGAQYADVQHQTIREEEARIIADALRELDDSLRVPLVLRYFCDQDSSQIAQVLDLPASTVRSRLKTARLMLTKKLLEQGVEP